MGDLPGSPGAAPFFIFTRVCSGPHGVLLAFSCLAKEFGSLRVRIGGGGVLKSRRLFLRSEWTLTGSPFLPSWTTPASERLHESNLPAAYDCELRKIDGCVPQCHCIFMAGPSRPRFLVLNLPKRILNEGDMSRRSFHRSMSRAAPRVESASSVRLQTAENERVRFAMSLHICVGLVAPSICSTQPPRTHSERGRYESPKFPPFHVTGGPGGSNLPAAYGCELRKIGGCVPQCLCIFASGPSRPRFLVLNLPERIPNEGDMSRRSFHRSMSRAAPRVESASSVWL